MRKAKLSAALAAAAVFSFICGETIPADDAAYEQYSMEVGEAIANASGSGSGDETEADSPIHRGVDAEDTGENGKLRVNSFHGYEWGTSLEQIQKAETADLDATGWSLTKTGADGMTVTSPVAGQRLYDVLGLKGYQIAGYDATSFYVFDDGKLTGGVYEYFMDAGGFVDTLDQCIEAYGKPFETAVMSEASEEFPSSSGASAQSGTEEGGLSMADSSENEAGGGDEPGSYAVWADADGNFIFLAESLGVMYGQSESPIIGMFSDGIERSCGIDLAHAVRAAREAAT